jgi:hypothetical protein
MVKSFSCLWFDGNEAQMPSADELPAAVAPLARRNAVEISPLTFDTKRLISHSASVASIIGGG